jgi:hypothetical protein
MKASETTTDIAPDFAAESRRPWTILRRASAVLRKCRQPVNAWTGSARKTGDSSASRTSPLN